MAGRRDEFCVSYLIGSSIEDVRQELQLLDSSDMGRHLNHSDQLIALQTPQMQQVGTTASDEPLAVPAATCQALFNCYCDIVSLKKHNTVSQMTDALCDGKGSVGNHGSRIWHWKLMFVDKTVCLPREHGAISETTQHGVTEWQEKDLQQNRVVRRMSNCCLKNFTSRS